MLPSPAVLPDLAPPDGTTLAADHAGAAWAGTVAAYLAEVRQRTGSERTPIEYGRILARFLGGLPDPGAALPAYVHAFSYGVGPSGRAPSPSTITVRLAAVRGLYDFARRMGLVKSNPADGDHVKRPHQRAPTPHGLDADQLRQLLAAVPDKPSGARDRAIILTCIFTGLRRQEVMRLRKGDLTRDGRTVYYHAKVKGGMERHRELPAPAYVAIMDALEATGRPLATLPAEARLFAVSDAGFYANLRRYSRHAGLPPVAPHALRHSAAKLRRAGGATIEEVGALLGHRNLYTTARYLARLEGERDTGWASVAAALGVPA